MAVELRPTDEPPILTRTQHRLQRPGLQSCGVTASAPAGQAAALPA
jgi:hypothetical protein